MTRLSAAQADVQDTAAGDRSREYRLTLSQEILSVLEAQYQVYGREAAEVIREVLGEWARRKREEAELILRLLKTTEPAGGDLIPDLLSGLPD